MLLRLGYTSPQLLSCFVCSCSDDFLPWAPKSGPGRLLLLVGDLLHSGLILLLGGEYVPLNISSDDTEQAQVDNAAAEEAGVDEEDTDADSDDSDEVVDVQEL